MNITAESTSKSSIKQLLIIALAVLVFCWVLFWMDHETKQLADLLKPGNLAALALYYIPTFFINGFLYEFLKKMQMKRPLIFSLILGIPTGITLIICTLLFFKN